MTIPASLIQNAVLAADAAAMEPHVTPADQTRAVVRRVIEFLVGNGLITITPEEDWPVWLVMDPPFDSSTWKRAT